VLPIVLSVGAARVGAHARQLDLSNADLRRAADGWHVVMRLADGTHRLWLAKLPKLQSIAVELPLDVHFDVRAHAARRLWSALEGRRVQPPWPSLSARSRQQLTLAIRAFDGDREDNSYRVIATALYGESRVSAKPWKTHELRSHVIRLVKAGKALVHGGYRALLRMDRGDR
jgi:hypothetical protein